MPPEFSSLMLVAFKGIMLFYKKKLRDPPEILREGEDIDVVCLYL